MTKTPKVYNPQQLEQKYGKLWLDLGVYEPDLAKEPSAQAEKENPASEENSEEASDRTPRNTSAPSISRTPRSSRTPYYNLMMFPYPSAEGLHVGNMYAFTGADVHGRFRRQQGYDVFEPIGLDGFGIHSENYAIKVGTHPAQQAAVSQKNFYRQLQLIGNGFAWQERLETYDPHYYRWTQWLFSQMFKKGLAYKGEARVNWCPSCKTVLADEQVEDGQCERCKSEVDRRQMSSWYFAITEYADRLLENIENYQWEDVHQEKHQGLKWPNKVTSAQQNWIGRKEGLSIDFQIDQVDSNDPLTLTAWTTYWETIFGATYLVLAPENEAIAQLTTTDQQAKVETYIQQALNKSEQERKIAKEKTGVFTGSYALNPATKQPIPVYVADYVLPDVGTGVVMGVPAHDNRDFDFAKAYNLPIVQVVNYEQTDPEVNAQVAAQKQAHEAPGKLMNSQQFDGQQAWQEGKQAIKDWLIAEGFARSQRNYHLRDWLISRQRYWGPPIPLIYCEQCAKQNKGEQRQDLQGNKLDPIPGWYSVPDKDLPVELPHLKEFKPTGDGTSPLDNAPDSWKHVTCPGCGNPQAERETDVSDTFLDSSWYFLRYPALAHAKQHEHPFPQIQDDQARDWFPVNAYIGGAEHAVLHLLYARFVTMFLYDLELVPQEEPFPFLFGHGLIIKDGSKMSKSRGNVVNPDEYIAKYGADALRTYLMFLGPYEQGGDFRDTGMNGTYRWLNRVWETVQERVIQADSVPAQTSAPLAQQLHQTIKANTQEMAQFKFNTCIARLMELLNSWRDQQQDLVLSVDDTVKFLQLLAPFAPFMTEELYQQIGSKSSSQQEPTQDSETDVNTDENTDFASIHRLVWPSFQAELIKESRATIAIQVNGKLRATLEIPSSQIKDQERVVDQALQEDAIKQYIQAKEDIKKTIFVPGKIVNFVVWGSRCHQ